MKHYQGCSGPSNHCRCDEVDPTLRLSPEAQLDAIYEAEHLARLGEDGGPDPACDWPEHLRKGGENHEEVK